MASKEEIIAFLKKDFPQNKCIVEGVGEKFSRIRWPVSHEDLRPGGTVSGPSLMTAADVALYVAILGEIGIVPLAVTTNLNISFLRKPSPDRDLIAECRLIKLGRTLAMGDVFIYSDGSAQAVAHAVGTYAIPGHDKQSQENTI
ncbi:PaaI family thioesterase [Advenella sp. RU8]|uniref:PaaI family thioesterase n=1 Tax=Advenella sp. RU8 TaxID=3399575 RepID=UPI003AADE3BD